MTTDAVPAVDPEELALFRQQPGIQAKRAALLMSRLGAPERGVS